VAFPRIFSNPLIVLSTGRDL